MQYPSAGAFFSSFKIHERTVREKSWKHLSRNARTPPLGFHESLLRIHERHGPEQITGHAKPGAIIGDGDRD